MGKTSNRFEPYQDNFKDHFVCIYEVHHFGGVPVEMLTWRREGTLTGYVRFLRVGHELFVSGDWRQASYAWSSIETLSWMADTDFQYFHGKCTASPQGVPAREWDTEHFVALGAENVKQAITERWDEPEEEVTDDHPMVKAWHAINKLYCPPAERGVMEFFEQETAWEFANMVPEKYRNGIEVDDYDESVGHFFFGNYWFDCRPSGWVASMDCIIHHGALRLAMAWLKENKPDLWEKVQAEIEGV